MVLLSFYFLLGVISVVVGELVAGCVLHSRCKDNLNSSFFTYTIIIATIVIAVFLITFVTNALW